MKINGSPDPLRLNGGTGASKGKATEKAGSGAAAETVQLSSLPAQLAKLIEEAQAPNAVFDQSRVDAIKDALRRGEFKVDSSVVAERLLETVEKLVVQKG